MSTVAAPSTSSARPHGEPVPEDFALVESPVTLPRAGPGADHTGRLAVGGPILAAAG